MYLHHVSTWKQWFRLFDVCSQTTQFGEVEKMMLLNCWKADELWTVVLREPHDVYPGTGCAVCEIEHHTAYQVPCFICVDWHSKDIECLYVWVHPDFRNKGYATFLLKELNVVRGEEVTAESCTFWENCGFDVTESGTAVRKMTY